MDEIKYKDIPDYGDKIGLIDFICRCGYGLFTNYDGHGYYSDGKKMTNIRVLPSDIMNGKINSSYEFVIWFNK